MSVNTADILLEMFRRMEELIRSNEMLKAEINRLESKVKLFESEKEQ